MKYLVLTLFAFTALTTAQERDVAGRLAHIFMISRLEAEKCVQKMAMTSDDLWTLSGTAFDNVNLNNQTMRKVICTLTCCAQAQGTMIGFKLQIPAIHKLIQTAAIPPHIKVVFHRFVDECAEVVKDITDECEVAFQFIKCVSDKPWKDIMR